MIYIKGMEMPKSCFDCPFVDFEYGDCLVDENGHGDPNEPENCPLIPVPPHGRLIDADAMIKNMEGALWDWETVDGIAASTILKQTITDLRNAPTIIPADGKDGAE